MLSPGPTLVVTRDNFCPEGRRVSSKSPEGQKLSRGTTRVGPGDNKDSYPPEVNRHEKVGQKRETANFKVEALNMTHSLFLPSFPDP